MTTAPQSPPPCPWAAAADLIGDGASLRSILALAGSETGPRILAQMEADLVVTGHGLQSAVTARDFAAIRAQSHVLISIVGTIGAMGLHAAACRLNEAAHAADTGSVAALVPPLLADTARLVDAIRAIGAAR